MIGKIHHALVDGMAALQIVQLLADEAPGAADHPQGAAPAGPARRPAVGWARDSIGRAARDGVAVARAAARPVATARGAVRDVRRVLNAARDDVLPRAPDSPVNVPIGSRRTLVGYHADRSVVRAARAGGGSINDVGLAVVAGALRALALRQGDPPASPLKVMVPVNMRGGDEYGLPGNRISMVNLELPVDLAVAVERLQRIRTQTQHLKHGDRAEATESLYAAGALLPGPLRSAVAKAMASPRAFNLTISQSPAPRELSVLACALEEVYSVVPITQGHALSIGMIRFKQELFFGCYADPDAFPAVVELPSLLDAEMRALGARARRDGPQLIGSINGAPQRQALG
jgi:WS/DGAT/MGAT family acyltransferase